MKKWVLVTGSSRGIGRAIALRLAKDSYNIVLHGRSMASAQIALEEVRAAGAEVRAIAFDISDRAATREALEADVQAHGAYYGVVCNAGLSRDGAFPALSEDDWDIVMRTNLDGFFNVLQPLTMPLVRTRKPARIVTLASVSGLIGNRGQVNYSAAKAGIIGATKALAVELASRNITVNCVAPGFIETDMTDHLPVEEIMKMIPANRAGKPEEVASLVSYLMSDAAAYITRQVISVNGGALLMQVKRVVVTGMGGITAIGSDWETVEKNLRAGVTGVEYMSEWDQYKELNTRLGAPVKDFKLPPHYTRKQTRTMSRVAQLAVLATEKALTQAGLLGNPSIQDGRMGIAHGSCSGGTDAFMEFGGMLWGGVAGRSLNATTFLRYMSHTAGVNTGLYFGLKGRIIPTTSACTSGSQGVGYAYEAIKYGKQLLMVAGGSEELHAAYAAVFDTMFATSLRNDAPKQSPRPFDKTRDGLVIGEGAGTLILEELEHAQARSAKILAEVVGFGCNSDGDHATHPNTATMQVAMELALKDAELSASAIGYVSAHGTSTEQGDAAESQATSRLFGERMPISSMKSYLGHTLGACGAIESWWVIEMMNRGWFAPTHNLTDIDERCGKLDYITGAGRHINCEYVMNNNFAFGGINTSLIFKRWAD